jgi:polysaccharide chain length determinant protein (PEP-CTERM system associated)
MNDIPSLIQNLLNGVQSAWRFRWYGLTAAWAICLSGWLTVALLPNVYEATAAVYIDTSSVLRPLLSNQIVPQDVVAELTYARQALMGREHMERVARENGLDAGATTPSELNSVLSRLLRTIQIETRSMSNQPGNIVASIAYRHSEREKAIGVVESFLTSLVEETLGLTRAGTDTAGRFLEDRIAEYEHRLEEAERALADFKRENANRLPGTEGGYFGQINADRSALDAVQRQLRLAGSKASQIREQLNSSSPVMPSAEGGAELPANGIDARINDYRMQLDKLLLDFTDKHPDVIAMRQSLAQLEQQRAAQLRALGVLNVDQNIAELDANPVYTALRIALNEAEVDVATLQADIREREQKLKALQSLVDEVPQVEAELARLNRDYDIVQQQYQALIRSRETQTLSEKAADTDQVKFKVLNPPLAEFEPVAPNRPVYLAAVFVLALGIGGALCWFLSVMRPVFTSAAALRAAVGLPVIGVISEATQNHQRVRRAIAMAGFTVGVGLLASLFFLAVLYEVKGRGLHSLVSFA